MLGILLVPHPNSRYRQSELALAEAELQLSLDACGDAAELKRVQLQGVDCLAFEPETIEMDALISQLRRISTLYMLVELRPDGAFMPLAGARKPYLGEDISGILKYKGKTNEVFTRCLINLARLSSDYAQYEGRLCIADPICGRGTALLEALRAGEDSFGIECDNKSLTELEAFLKRYMEYHKFKHRIGHSSLTVDGKPCPQWELSCASTPEAWKAGDTRHITLVAADTLLTHKLVRKPRFHVMVGDLPYGVQHASKGEGGNLPTHRLLERALPGWREALLPGGALALSFNSYTLEREVVRDLMSRAGFEVKCGRAYDNLGHWVEQAVNREVAVAVRTD